MIAEPLHSYMSIYLFLPLSPLQGKLSPGSCALSSSSVLEAYQDASLPSPAPPKVSDVPIKAALRLIKTLNPHSGTLFIYSTPAYSAFGTGHNFCPVTGEDLV